MMNDIPQFYTSILHDLSRRSTILQDVPRVSKLIFPVFPSSYMSLNDLACFSLIHERSCRIVDVHGADCLYHAKDCVRWMFLLKCAGGNTQMHRRPRAKSLSCEARVSRGQPAAPGDFNTQAGTGDALEHDALMCATFKFPHASQHLHLACKCSLVEQPLRTTLALKHGFRWLSPKRLAHGVACPGAHGVACPGAVASLPLLERDRSKDC
jgi:hypothetical protein